MGKINLSRVILGGLLAGVVINIIEGVVNGGFLATDWADAMTALHQHSVSTKQIIAFNVWGFAIGILTVWLYAAMRPRYGAGPKTAICAGLFMWAVGYALANFAPVILHVFPVSLVAKSLSAELVEMVIAALAGAWLYKEAETTSANAMAARA